MPMNYVSIDLDTVEVSERRAGRLPHMAGMASSLTIPTIRKVPNRVLVLINGQPAATTGSKVLPWRLTVSLLSRGWAGPCHRPWVCRDGLAVAVAELHVLDRRHSWKAALQRKSR